jgi:hypothetical protein
VSGYNITVSGTLLGNTSLTAWVDGGKVPITVSRTSSGLLAGAMVNASAMTDGVHTLTVTASQSDGLSSTFSTTFTTDAHQLALEKQTSNLLDYAYVLAALALAALVVAFVALWRGSSKSSPSNPAPQV